MTPLRLTTTDPTRISQHCDQAIGRLPNALLPQQPIECPGWANMLEVAAGANRLEASSIPVLAPAIATSVSSIERVYAGKLTPFGRLYS